MQINLPPRAVAVPRLVHAEVVIDTVAVTITNNKPSPADDTPGRHAEQGHRFIRITNDGNIRKVSDG